MAKKQIIIHTIQITRNTVIGSWSAILEPDGPNRASLQTMWNYEELVQWAKDWKENREATRPNERVRIITP